ncbi:MAG TPA: hypothetical protein VMR92_07360, partial [Gemmatimonadales bacterium]|nr:hypothetical protein [Gemmatimonadales bacterium]
MRHITLLLAIALTAPAVAQVNPSGTWRTLHTEHFRIHFRPTYRQQALEAAAESERAYGLLATELHRPRGIIDLTISDDVDFPNGFTSTYPSNRFTILLTPPVTDPGLQNFDSWERLVIVHELTHVFHLDRARGIWGGLQRVFGRAPGLFPNQYQPSWVVEGLATYYESRFTNGGRADGSFQRELVAADLAAAGGHARRSWDALLFTRWPGGLTPYAYGSRFYEYLTDTKSDSIAPRFIEATASQLIPFRVGRPLRRTGIDLESSWKASVVAASAESTGTRSRLLVGGLRAEPFPRVSPDGRSIAYVHNDGRGAQRIRIIDPESGVVLRSHRVTGQVSFDWLGDTIVVGQLEFDGRWNLRSDLWRWSADGAWSRMTTNARLTDPRAGGGVLTSLRIMPGGNEPTRAATPIPMGESSASTWGPVVPSPDGVWLVAPRHRDGHWELVRWGREGSADAATVLLQAEPGAAVADPVWTRDGAVLFVTDVAGFSQVLQWREGNITQVTAEPHGARAPAPLSDGRILFTTPGADGWELRSVERVSIEPVAHAEAAAPPPEFVAAPAVNTRETGYASWGSLRPHFWIPLALNNGNAGFFVGAATAGVDAVGRYSYLAQGLFSGSPLRAQGSLFLISNVLGSPTLDFSVSNDWSPVGTDTAGHIVSSERREAAIGATVLDQHWWSFVSLRLGAEYEGRRYVSIPDTTLADICAGCNKHDRIGGVATLAIGSAVSGPLSVSLQDGARASFLYRNRQEQGTDRWLSEVRGRASAYLRLGPQVGFAYPVLAIRGALGSLDGPIPDSLSVGGVSSGAAELAFGASLGTFRTFPVRGYPAGALHGRRAATFTAEYRVPLALVGRLLGHLPIGADKFA